MRAREICEWGRIIKGVNTTKDVDEDFLKDQAEKFGNKVDRDGKPVSVLNFSNTGKVMKSD